MTKDKKILFITNNKNVLLHRQNFGKLQQRKNKL